MWWVGSVILLVFLEELVVGSCRILVTAEIGVVDTRGVSSFAVMLISH